MGILKSIAIAFSMFSRIPVPEVEWNPKNMRYMMACFPLVGVAVGAVESAWIYLAGMYLQDGFLLAAGCALIPLIMTGGIHMDGFCDTVDALSSRADKEKKLQILRDPHIGAFGAMACAAYILLFAALFSALDFNGSPQTPVIPLMFVLSRTLSGLATVCFPTSKESGLLKTFSDAAAKKRSRNVLIVILVFVCAAMLAANPLTGAAAIVAAFLTLLVCRHIAMREFGGISGDVAGWFLQICEITCLLGIVLSQSILLI